MSKWLNPPFDPRIKNIGSPSQHSNRLKRGHLTLAEGNQRLKGKGVRFLYNPVSVSVNHSISMAMLTNSNKQQPAQNQTSYGRMNDIGSVSLDLLYDRTYELWDGSKSHTHAGRYGVYSDVLAFYRLLGIVKDTQVFDPLHWVEYEAFNTMPEYPISGNNLFRMFIGDKLRFFGKVSDFNITYSHWNQRMVPARCAVSLSLHFQTEPKNSNPTIRKGVHTVPHPHNVHRAGVGWRGGMF